MLEAGLLVECPDTGHFYPGKIPAERTAIVVPRVIQESAKQIASEVAVEFGLEL